MANNIRGITIEIDGKTDKLQNALQGVDKNLRSTKSELKEVERALKLDPKNTELLAQKQQLLTKAVGETKDKLDVLKTAEAQVQEQGRSIRRTIPGNSARSYSNRSGIKEPGSPGKRKQFHACESRGCFRNDWGQGNGSRK